MDANFGTLGFLNELDKILIKQSQVSESFESEVLEVKDDVINDFMGRANILDINLANNIYELANNPNYINLINSAIEALENLNLLGIFEGNFSENLNFIINSLKQQKNNVDLMTQVIQDNTE